MGSIANANISISEKWVFDDGSSSKERNIVPLRYLTEAEEVGNGSRKRLIIKLTGDYLKFESLNLRRDKLASGDAF